MTDERTHRERVHSVGATLRVGKKKRYRQYHGETDSWLDDRKPVTVKLRRVAHSGTMTDEFARSSGEQISTEFVGTR